MQKTFTLEFDTLNIAKQENELKAILFNDNQKQDEPSSFCINNILNYSKNLEVKTSTTLGHVDFLRS
ncbi:MAG: hypothetical protein SGJ15_04015 [Bacteroidota bacterium]|nr:hypothetical protein [Bacteroidota bacterium]